MKKETKYIFGLLIFGVAFILIVVASYQYLMSNTNLQNQAKELIGDKIQSIPNNTLWYFSIGTILFIIFIIFFSKRKLEIFCNSLIDSLQILFGAILILALFGTFFKLWFKISLIVAYFIFYYSTYLFKDIILPDFISLIKKTKKKINL